jgi:biotin operon repressor
MSTRTRLKQLEKQKQAIMTWREFITLDGEAWERSKNALADALNITRAELEKQLTELFGDKPTAKP